MTTQTTPPPIERASVEQADRVLAAHIARLLTGAAVEHILEGFEDETGTVQAVAAHRQQAHAAGVAEGLEQAAKVIEEGWRSIQNMGSVYDGPTIHDLPAAIRNLSPGEIA